MNPSVKATARDRYVLGADRPSIRQLAAELGLSYVTLGRWSRREGWVRQRTQHVDRVHTKTAALVVGTEAQIKARQLARVRQVQDAMLDALPKATPRSQEGVGHVCLEAVKAERLILGEATERVDDGFAQLLELLKVSYQRGDR